MNDKKIAMNTGVLTKTDWARIDKAFNSMEHSMLECCIVLAKYEDKQKEIAVRRGLAVSSVSEMIAVGKSADKFGSTELLPTGWHALYLLSDLSAEQIDEVCSRDEPPTQKQIKEYKVKVGLLPAPVEIDRNEQDRMLRRLLTRDTNGLSPIGIRGLKKRNAKIRSLITSVPRPVQKTVIHILEQIADALHTTYAANVRGEVSDLLAKEKANLDAREKRLAAREVGLKNRITDKEIKLIQGCLHPDKVGNGDAARYGQAFDAFRKAL